MITATSYEKVGSYETQFGIADDEDLAVAVLVLQPFAVQRCSTGRRRRSGTRGRACRPPPSEVADALETEHRIIDVERNHRHVVAAV